MYDDPIAMARAYENAGIACVLATMLPSHYQAALPHLKPFSVIRPSLGLHPLRSVEGQKEVALFLRLASSVQYIGEIGLDLSSEGRKTRDVQYENLQSVLPAIRSGTFVTVHSRNAHKELALLLDEHSVGPVCFHYFVGGPRDAEKLAGKGHFFSINHRMLAGRHQNILDAVPRDKVIVETDGPFLTKDPLAAILKTYSIVSHAWGLSIQDVEKQIESNFQTCRTYNNF